MPKLPLYEYQCPNDGTFEQMQKFSDPPLSECPKCGAPVEKLLSAPAIQFKGTGWYITDYARKSSGDKGGKDGKEKAGATESKAGESSTKDSGAGSTASSGGTSSSGGSDKK